jgi:hypothetical protein
MSEMIKTYLNFKKTVIDDKVIDLNEWLKDNCSSPAEAIVVTKVWLQHITEEFGIEKIEVNLNGKAN